MKQRLAQYQISFGIALLCFDQFSKALAQQLGLLQINRGLALSLAASLPAGERAFLVQLLLNGLILAILAVLWLRAWQSWGIVLLLSGGVSNFLDRLLFAGVRDFLPVPGLPITNNSADYFVAAGSILLLLQLWRPEKPWRV